MGVWPPSHEVASSKVWPPVTTGNPLSLQVSLALLPCLHNKHGLAFKHLSSSWYSMSILLVSLHNKYSLAFKHLSSLVILYEYTVGQPAQQIQFGFETLVFTCHTLWVYGWSACTTNTLPSLVILYEYTVGQPAQQTLVFSCHILSVYCWSACTTNTLFLHLSYSMSILLVSLHNKHLSSPVILSEYNVGQPAQQTLVFTCHTLCV